jgi:hypothetical protein
VRQAATGTQRPRKLKYTKKKEVETKNVLSDAPDPRKMASRPVAWMASTMDDGAAVTYPCQLNMPDNARQQTKETSGVKGGLTHQSLRSI